MKREFEIIFMKNTDLICEIEKTITLLSRQNYYQAINSMTGLLSLLDEVIEGTLREQDFFAQGGLELSAEMLVGMLQSLLKTVEEKEYVLLADLLQQTVLPFCYRLQETIVTGNLCTPVVELTKGKNRYRVEYTASGLLTLCTSVCGKENYWHSNRNARTEAAQLADAWYEEEAEEYLIYGCGLGYVVDALLKKSEYIHVQVFESDIKVLELAKKYGVIQEHCEKGRMTIAADENGSALIQAIHANPKAAVRIFYPAIRMMEDKNVRERMEDIFISQASAREQRSELFGNFRENCRHYDASADALRPQFAGNRVYLVAAGPSLDKNYMLLNKAKKNGVLVAVGTVLKKLLRNHIVPDYVVVTDAKSNTFVQVEGVLDAGVPLLGLSTAYYRFFTDYKAKHYLLCQEGFAPAEEYAQNKGYSLISTGGSVITAALAAVCKLGAKEVVFVGLDLAFTGGRDHARDTDYLVEKISGEQRMVRDIEGNLVPTARNFDMYRRFIEQLIATNKEVHFYDATQGGALVAGTEVVPLANLVDNGAEDTEDADEISDL